MMSDHYDEYYLAMSQHTSILADLAAARTKLSTLQHDPHTSPITIKQLQNKIKLLVRLALASQQAAALKEEALGEA